MEIGSTCDFACSKTCGNMEFRSGKIPTLESAHVERLIESKTRSWVELKSAKRGEEAVAARQKPGRNTARTSYRDCLQIHQIRKRY